MPPFSIVVATPPAAEPVTLSDAKLHLKIDHAADDDVLNRLIKTAREIVEAHTGLALITRTVKLFLDRWPADDAIKGAWWDGMREGVAATFCRSPIALPLPPLQTLNSIKVYAADDTHQTLPPTQYVVDTNGIPARLVFRPDATPPAPARAMAGIEISITCGYGPTAADVPATIRQAVLQLVASLYEHRGDTADIALKRSGAEVLLGSYKKMRIL